MLIFFKMNRQDKNMNPSKITYTTNYSKNTYNASSQNHLVTYKPHNLVNALSLSPSFSLKISSLSSLGAVPWTRLNWVCWLVQQLFFRSKTKEMMVDFRRQEHSPRKTITKLKLSVNTSNLPPFLTTSWNGTTTLKKLYLLWKLNYFSVDQKILTLLLKKNPLLRVFCHSLSSAGFTAWEWRTRTACKELSASPPR